MHTHETLSTRTQTFATTVCRRTNRSVGAVLLHISVLPNEPPALRFVNCSYLTSQRQVCCCGCCCCGLGVQLYCSILIKTPLTIGCNRIMFSLWITGKATVKFSRPLTFHTDRQTNLGRKLFSL